ncbi:MAG: hypothetical protein AB7O62_22755 [Pirellulales bacterium]
MLRLEFFIMQRWVLAALAFLPCLVPGRFERIARADVGPVPQWIWRDAFPRRQQTVWFRRDFMLANPPRKAELSGLADDRMTVFINGVEAASLEGTQAWQAIDVAPRLRQGRNRVTVRAYNERGAAGMLLKLTVEDDQGRQQTLTTDQRWLASGQPWPTDAAANSAHPAAAAHGLGLVGVQPWGLPEGDKDDYDQWKQALPAGNASAAGDVRVMPGFSIELLKSAAPEEGSWIAMAFDPQGRLTISREGRRNDNGLLRLTLPDKAGQPIAVETINDTLEECRGLLYAHGALYANANNSRGLYRLRDTNGDDRFDDIELLQATGGGVGHGRNDLALGPDGMIYSIHGNNVLLPDGFQTGQSPFRDYGPDRLRPCFWDRMLFDAGVSPPAGHVVRTDAEGSKWELVAGGFRNAYGLDFDAAGNLFTFDADMEWDVGAPWYKPTRINHVVAGGEYGYRQGTANRPAWLPDNLPSNLDLGLGSPTAVKFGTNSNFPPEYQRALFALEWSYGRIYAIHLAPDGASYRCRAERFVEGRPLNVTDIDFGPDGAMYFITGGRDTQSGLYRVRATEGPAPLIVEVESSPSENLAWPALSAGSGRLTLAAQPTAELWDWLDSQDAWRRQAGRVALESRPLDQWQAAALAESRPNAGLTALLALARVGTPEAQAGLIGRLNHWLGTDLSPEQQVLAVRAYALSFTRQGRPSSYLAAAARAKLEEAYPAEFSQVNQQLCELLAYLESPRLVETSLHLLDECDTSEDQLCYLYTLRNVRVGWTPALRERYFRWLRKAEESGGAVYMPTFMSYIRSEAEAWLSPDERAALGDLAATAAIATTSFEPPPPRAVVREWKMEELLDSLEEAGRGRNFQRGETLFAAALCNRCHLLGKQGLPLGPELTAVGKRFNRKDLLESIINPSKVVEEKYRTSVLQTADGETLTGRIVGGSETTLIVATDPLDPRQMRHLPLADIESQTTSSISLMPAGLLNTLTRDEILDLLAYLQTGGDKDAPNFQR